jgi:hypothetical protein
MIRLALRFDDPSATSDRALEEGILAAARDAEFPLTLAVIPFKQLSGELIPFTATRADHLIQAHRDGVIEVAQHGFCHEQQNEGKSPPSEFSSIAFDKQLQKIREGRANLTTLFGENVAGFVPPWNTFDASTTRALVQCGFRYLSAGEEIEPNCESELAYLPRTCQMTDLGRTLETLAPFASFEPVVVAVMHHYDFAESGNPRAATDLDQFSELLQRLRQDSRLRISTLSGLIDAPCGTLASRLKQKNWCSLHWQIRRRLPDHAMFQQSWLRLLIRTLRHSS